ncbi:MAG: toprim domain-containing protein, partial [Parcubacteria group bacterium]|nr:toprim domain-containing protein [Parcubacteria group bacterium]
QGIQSLLLRTVQCDECRRYFSSGGGPASGRDGVSPRCTTCADPAADTKTLMVVEKDVDLATVEKSGAYHGRFFILGSLIPLKEIKNPVVSPRIGELKAKIEKNASDGTLKEIILALSATPEGDHTALELKIFLKPLQEKHGITISSLGRGLSTGSELEYADGETLKSALESRK